MLMAAMAAGAMAQEFVSDGTGNVYTFNSLSQIEGTGVTMQDDGSYLVAADFTISEGDVLQMDNNAVIKMANGVRIIEAPTPIVPIFTYKTLDTLYFGKKMFEEGVYVNPVIAPACVEGECLLRTTLMATHTEPVIDEAVEIIARVLKEGAPQM
jgi:hypothetical protein